MDWDLVYRSPDNPNSHLTAKDRDGPSYPTRRLLLAGLLTGAVLDFGCGKGADVRFLRAKGFDVTGFDPHYSPARPQGLYDTIICHYVLNVLLPEEQSHVLMAVSELLRPGGTAYFAVRRDVKKDGFRIHARHRSRVYQCNVVLPYPSFFRNDHCEIYLYRHINQMERRSGESCPLCQPAPHWQLVTESARAYCIVDPGASSVANCLIVPKHHAADYFDLPARVQAACWLMAARVKGLLSQQLRPTGLTFTIDVGGPAGEPVQHACVRVSATR
ncbi:MAG: methyltransferase domain-containing protein [Anaerolineae bacterium]|nr:methyltransferase domain-containing protein [Anaerolineae bacterium]